MSLNHLDWLSDARSIGLKELMAGDKKVRRKEGKFNFKKLTEKSNCYLYQYPKVKIPFCIVF